MVDKSRRDRPKIEITDEMIELGAQEVSQWGDPPNPVGFALALKKALAEGGYAVQIPAWIEQES